MNKSEGGIVSLILGCSFGTLIANILLSENAMKKVIFAVKWGMNNPLKIIYCCTPLVILVVIQVWYKILYKSRWLSIKIKENKK